MYLRSFKLIFILNFCHFILFFTEVQSTENQEKTVLLAILARNKAHVLPTYLQCIKNLDYDKKLISIYINTNNNVDDTNMILKDWIQKNQNLYNQIVLVDHQIQDVKLTRPHEWNSSRFKILADIRNASMQKAKDLKTDYYFVVDCDNFIAPFTLKELIQKNKPIIAPMLQAIPEKNDCYSNFFCDVTETGYYKDHPNYLKILTYLNTGSFKVPVVHCTYLIKSDYLDQLNYTDGTDHHEFVIFSRAARDRNIDQFICNEKKFGFLLHFHENIDLEEEKKRIEDIDIVNLIQAQ